jgi:hypothetical protein
MRDSAFCFEMCKDLDGQLGMQTINETLEQDQYNINNAIECLRDRQHPPSLLFRHIFPGDRAEHHNFEFDWAEEVLPQHGKSK